MRVKVILFTALLWLIVSAFCFSQGVAVTKVGQLGGDDYRSVAVSGNYAYCAADQNGLIIVDITDPANPFVKGRYNTPGHSRSVKVTGNYAYVADKYGGLRIVNISNPSAPTLAGSCHYGNGWAEDLDLSGNYAYVSYDYGGLRVFNISDPANPTWVSSFATEDDTEGIAVSGNYAYIPLEDDGIQVVNISNPAAPYQAQWLKKGDSGEDVAISGNYAYVTDSGDGLLILDISNPSAAQLKGSYETPGAALGIDLSGNYAYVADSYNGLQVINISNPSAPGLAGSYNESGLHGSDIAISGNYAYVTDGVYNKFRIFRISEGASKAITVNSPTGGETWDIGTTHYIYWAHSGLTGDITIKLYKGGTYHSTIGTAAVINGKFRWAIPTSLDPGSDYKIKIYQGGVSGFSADNFSITGSGSISPFIALNRTGLNFGAAGGNSTKAQTVLISNSGQGTLNWSVSPDQGWINVTPTYGTGSGTIQVSVSPAGLGSGTYSGTVYVTDAAASNSPQQINVTLKVYANSSEPFGDFATPVNNSTVCSSIPVTGWVLDDVEVTSIGIYRDPVPGEGTALIYIGDAVFVEGARPDVEQAYQDYPLAYFAGWGYMMLTNFLPNSGNGTFTIYAKAVDREGHEVTLGQKTIICDNAHAVKPFGAIDTPIQGGTSSGNSFVNWGWILTPQPNAIPTDGSTINVIVDGVSIGHPSYNNYRADIANKFPGYVNSNGAVGYFSLDTTAYENGVHSISWTASDDAGNTDGIGSRYFTIQNTNTGSESSTNARSKGVTVTERVPVNHRKRHAAFLNKTPVDYLNPIPVKIGFNESSRPQEIYPDENGVINIEVKELQRIKMNLDGPGWRGFQLVGDRLRKLPIGSTFDARRGIFYWQVGPGFFGDYSLVFINDELNGNMEKKYVNIRILSKFQE